MSFIESTRLSTHLIMDAGTAASVNYIWIETIAYAVCAVLMIFFGVERNLKAEQQEIANRVSK